MELVSVLAVLTFAGRFSSGKAKKQPPEVFYKKGVLENFAKFTGKQLHW